MTPYLRAPFRPGHLTRGGPVDTTPTPFECADCGAVVVTKSRVSKRCPECQHKRDLAIDRNRKRMAKFWSKRGKDWYSK